MSSCRQLTPGPLFKCIKLLHPRNTCVVDFEISDERPFLAQASDYEIAVNRKKESLSQVHEGRVQQNSQSWVGEVKLTNREPLPGTRFNQLPTVNLATLNGKPILAGLSIESNFSNNDKGLQKITLDGEACRTGNAIRITNPMAATVGVTDWTMGAIEFTVDPTQAAEQTMAFVA